MFNMGFPAFDRRHFLKHLAGFSAMALPGFRFLQRLQAAGPQMKKEGKSLIVLWMSGGPPTIDLWDMKPGAATAFEGDKPIATPVSGIQISANLPKVAAQMKHLAIVRSLSTREGDHARGTTLMHTGRSPNPVVTNPAIGAMVAYRNREKTKDMDLPSFISVGGSRTGPGFLGMNYAPFVLSNPGAPPENLKPPANVGAGVVQMDRVQRRRRLFYTVEDHFRDQLTPYMKPDPRTGEVSDAERKKVADAVVAHEEVYGKAFRLVASDSGKVFEFSGDDRKLMNEYTVQAGPAFGRGCLMARKLVEAGVTAVEVVLDGWDLHQNTQAGVKRLGGILDAGMGTLVKDLVQRGLWDKTVLLWMGEFGRTPRINANMGRDHWPNTWSVVLGGGGIKGGQVYGATNETGMEIADARCSVGDVFATVYQALGFDPKTDRDVRDNLGRPFPLTEDGSQPLKGLV